MNPAAQIDLFGAPRLYTDTPRSRVSDPESSHAAADEVKSSGRLAIQQSQVLAAVRQWPGRTSRELAQYMSADRHMVARRTSELATANQIRRSPVRQCSVGNRLAVEWWPVP